MDWVRVGVLAAGLGALTGCYSMRGSAGAGQAKFAAPRAVNPGDVAVPSGYRVEVVATNLTFPTGIAFDGNGTACVVESGYSYGEKFTTPRLLRLTSNGPQPIASGSNNGPWDGVAFHDGNFYVAEGGAMEGGRLLKISGDGKISVLVSNLPSGDHHTDGPVVAADGRIYFGQGTTSNSGVVGEDNWKFGWLKRHHEVHDVPGQDIQLTGQNFDSRDFIKGSGRARTGAFVPFGTATTAGQTIKGQVPCSGGIMSVNGEGGDMQLVAWGFRNPFGMAMGPDGKLFVTDNGYDDRGSRPAWGTSDLLWEVRKGTWYGWPDFSGDKALSDPDFKPPHKPKIKPLIANPQNAPPVPAAKLGVHAGAGGLDFSRRGGFGNDGEAFVALLGDESPTTGKSLKPVGCRVVKVNVRNGDIEDFAVNKGKKNGPASRINSGGLERPVAVKFSPDGKALYVVDFGVLMHDKSGAKPQEGTGVIWRIVREGGAQ
jgi:glucose/arabinose dehydrogenase